MAVKETVIKTICCDLCRKEIQERTFYKNDGSFQDTYLSINNEDYCFKCAGKILTAYNRRDNINYDEFKRATRIVKHGIGVPFDKLKLKKYPDLVNPMVLEDPEYPEDPDGWF